MFGLAFRVERITFTRLQKQFSMNRNLPALTLAALCSSLSAQPVINKNPQSQALCVDTCTELTVGAVGLGEETYVYQWQADEGAGFTNLGSAAVAQTTLQVCGAGISAPKDIKYRSIVSDTNGLSDTSSTAVISFDECLPPVADFTVEFSSVTERCFTNTSLRANSITWSFGDDITDESQDQQPCHDYGTRLIFDVSLYAFNDYGWDEKIVTIDLLAVEEINDHFRVYPNPVADLLGIESNLRIEAVELLDMNGRIVLSRQQVGNDVRIYIAALDKGLYTLRLTVDGQPVHRKIVKH